VPSDQRPDTSDSAGARAILDASIRHVAEEGLEAVTLRPLAERAGVSVATVTHYLGAKDQVLASIAAYARAQDEAFFTPWLERASQLDTASHAARSLLIEEAFYSWLAEALPRVVTFCEFVGSKSCPADARAAFRQWADLHLKVWTHLAGDADTGLLVMAYIADEAAFSLTLSPSPAYRCLRRLCLNQLLTGPSAKASERRASMALFRRLQDEMAPPHSIVGSAPTGPAKKLAIAEAAGRVIVETGVGGVTHRAVAAVAEVPPSTVVYHFGAQETLVEAGLEAVIRHFRTWLSAQLDGVSPEAADIYRATEDLVRATHAVALGAVRFPSLLPLAADMRLRRGENIRADNFARSSGRPEQHFDAFSAQVTSCVTFGARMLAMSLGESQLSRLSDLQAALTRHWTAKNRR
jgi:AcrR family transcriptional regulator